MRKMLFVITILMAIITMYFVVFWEPSSKIVANLEKNEITDENKEGEEQKVSEKENRIKKREEEKRVEEERIDAGKQKEEEKTKNLETIKRIENDIIKEDSEKIEVILNELSTIDLMSLRKHLEDGNLAFANKMLKERLLTEDSNLVFEIIKKYK